jgi:hypothetical protein
MKRAITIGTLLSALVLTVQMYSVPPAVAASAWEQCAQAENAEDLTDLDRMIQA